MLYFFLLLILSWGFVNSKNFVVNIDTSEPVRSVPEKFLSISIDTGNAKNNYPGLNLTLIQTLAKPLSPAYLRFGGTAADCLFFGDYTNTSISGTCAFNLSKNNFDELYAFTKNSDLKLLFDLNLLNRNGSSWDENNVKELLDYANSKGYEMDFELGNEPDQYHKWRNNFTVSGEQIADDYVQLNKLLKTYDLYKNSTVVGMDITSNGGCCSDHLDPIVNKTIQSFIKNGGGNYIDALTWHYYYGAGRTMQEKHFLNHTFMDHFLLTLNMITNVSNNYPHIWLGETSSCYNGGAVNLSDRYVAGFLWLDKLGLGALHGVDVLIRQELVNANYALLGFDMLPNPDYWLSLLYKKIIGDKVYKLTFDPEEPNLRLYGSSYKNSDNIVVYGQYMGNDSFTLFIPSLSSQATLYLLKEAEPGNLQSKLSKLNGNLNSWQPHQPGPNLRGTLVNQPIELPAYSQFFVVFNRTTYLTCPDGWINEKTIPNKCIKIIENAQPLFASNFECNLNGFDRNNASILSINNAFENAEIFGYAKNSSCDQFYTGLTKNGDSWTWNNGDPSLYFNWKKGYPLNDDTKNCVTFEKSSGNWANVDCDSFQCYICQMFI